MRDDIFNEISEMSAWTSITDPVSSADKLSRRDCKMQFAEK